MRRYSLVMVFLACLVQACSMFALGGPTSITQPPPGTPTSTLAPTRTSTPTVSPTFTPSATIVHIPTQDFNLPTSTDFVIPIIVEGGMTATIAPYNITPTAFRPGPGFVSVVVSDSKIFWGSCKHNKTTITTIVEDPREVFSVIIFVRVKSAKKEDYTPWTTGNAMNSNGNGEYSEVLRGIEIEGHNHYLNSWVIFQLVATNIEGKEVGRTMVYDHAIALSPCE